MKYYCDECGAEMINKSEGPYIHFVCPKCGKALASYDPSKEDPIKFDETIYYVKSKSNKPDCDNIKVLSEINGLNYLKCKQIIENNDIITTGKALDIIIHLKLLKQNNIQFTIEPNFVYKV